MCGVPTISCHFIRYIIGNYRFDRSDSIVNCYCNTTPVKGRVVIYGVRYAEM